MKCSQLSLLQEQACGKYCITMWTFSEEVGVQSSDEGLYSKPADIGLYHHTEATS